MKTCQWVFTELNIYGSNVFLKIDKTPEKMRPGAIFGKEEKFFKLADCL